MIRIWEEDDTYRTLIYNILSANFNILPNRWFSICCILAFFDVSGSGKNCLGTGKT